jgi:transposase
MGNVVEIIDSMPVWVVSSARCGACGHRWVAVWPGRLPDAKSHGWECPECHERAGLETERHT